jgi:predicted  nucleic acid-binding Zn-ribbon protein
MAEVSLPPLSKKDDQTDDTTTSVSTSLLPPKSDATMLPPKPAAKKEPEPEPEERPYFDPYTRRFIFTDPKKQAEYEKGRVEGYKGVASGYAQPVVGVGQLAATLAKKAGVAGADDFENYLAETQRTLKKYGAPVGQKIGELGTYLSAGRLLALLGGGALLGEELGGSGSEFLAPYIPRASWLVPETVKRGYRWLAGTAPETKAAVAEAAPETETAVAETLDPTKIEEKISISKRAIKELQELSKNMVAGTATGGAFGLIEPRDEKTAEERSTARRKAVIDGLLFGGVLGTATGIGSSLVSGLGDVWNNLNLKDQKKLVEAAKDYLIRQTEDLESMVRERLSTKEERIKKATEAQTQAETQLTPIQQKIEELVSASREAKGRELFEGEEAKNLNIPEIEGMTRRQAEAHVAQQQGILDKAKEDAVSDLEKRIATNPNLTAADLGRVIQPHAEQLKKDLELTVKKNSGYAGLENKYKEGKPEFSIKPIFEKIDEILRKKLSGSDAEYFLENLKMNLKKDAKALGSEDKVSFQQIDEALKKVQSAISKGIVQRSGAERNVAGSNLKGFEPIEQAIIDSIQDTEKTFDSVRKKYADLKAELDPYEADRGVFQGATEKRYGKNYEMLPGDVLTQVITRTKAGAEGLGTLVAKNPELKTMVRDYLEGELFGPSKESAAKVTAEKLDDFRKNYKDVLTQTGLDKDFADLASARRGAEERISKAEKGLTEAKNVAQSTADKLQQEEDQRKWLKKNLETQAKPLQRTAKGAAAEIKAAQDEKYKLTKLVGDINALSKPIKPGPENVNRIASNLESFVDRLQQDRPTALSEDAYTALKKNVHYAVDEYKRTGDELKFARDLRTFGVVKILSSLGIGAGFGMWRIGREVQE